FFAAATLYLAGAACAADTNEVAAVISRHGLQEDATPIRQSALWRAPKKIVLLQFGGPWEHPDAFRRAAGSANLVVAADLDSAVAAVADADGIIGANPEICDPRIINSAKQVRWLASLSAGVELCMQLPAVKARTLNMTNMRGIDSP